MDGTRAEDNTLKNAYVAHILKTLRKDWDEFVFLGFVAVVTLIAYLEARTLLPQSRYVPTIIIGMMAGVLVFSVIMNLFGDEITNKLGISESASGLDIEQEEDETTERLYDLNPVPVMKHFAWISLYLGSMIYVGFWTTNILFPFAYIMLYETSSPKRRFVYFAIWTALILAILWILFVELLQVQAIWRLGFLP